MSRWLISQIERGEIGRMPLDTLEKVATALEIRLQVIARWRGGDLDRLVNARHSALHELVARYLSAQDGWVFAPEVSFAIVGERGVIDILAWHPATRSLLVIELKTEVVDVQEAVGTLDRKRRLALRIAAERGWRASTVSVWMIVAEGTANRRRIANHRVMLRAALPADGWAMRGGSASRADGRSPGCRYGLVQAAATVSGVSPPASGSESLERDPSTLRKPTARLGERTVLPNPPLVMLEPTFDRSMLA